MPPEVPRAVALSFEEGTLVLDPPGALGPDALPPAFVPDPRSGSRPRAPAIAYRRGLAHLIRGGFDVDDRARTYESLDLDAQRTREPFPHQQAALDAWTQAGRRGVVVLPTGAGKSYVAEMAIAQVQRSTLVVAPTIDLMTQWMNLLGAAFGDEQVGGMGGGLMDVRVLTVSTYDSAYIHMPRLGGRFGLVVFDECHHLPGPTYAQAAECAIAPFRLGLTATPERPDGSHALLDHLVGPTVYRRDIQDMTGEYLAKYDVVRLRVSLSAEERGAYEEARETYLTFIRESGVRLGGRDGWSRFVQMSSRSTQGRRAWRAWRTQRGIALRCEAKLTTLGRLLWQHRTDQTLIFTADNDTVYAIARRHLVPAITHQTPTVERRRILERFGAGELKAIVTSRVLNEGVDLPGANVGIVLSGSASVREHVQRLGRILRRRKGKEALLYEVISTETAEERTSDLRRDHGAYRTAGRSPSC